MRRGRARMRPNIRVMSARSAASPTSIWPWDGSKMRSTASSEPSNAALEKTKTGRGGTCSACSRCSRHAISGWPRPAPCCPACCSDRRDELAARSAVLRLAWVGAGELLQGGQGGRDRCPLRAGQLRQHVREDPRRLLPDAGEYFLPI